MKIRAGFVSNSSSTAFILDLRNEQVKKIVYCEDISLSYYGLGRYTCAYLGDSAVNFARHYIMDWHEEDGDCARYDPENDDCLGCWILKWAEELGHDHIAFVRGSDEGMGGWLKGRYRDIAVAEREYH